MPVPVVILCVVPERCEDFLCFVCVVGGYSDGRSMAMVVFTLLYHMVLPEQQKKIPYQENRTENSS